MKSVLRFYVGLAGLEVRDEDFVVERVGADRVELDDLAAEVLAERIRETAAVVVVLIEDRGFLMAGACRELRHVRAVRGVARDHAERPRRYAGEVGRAGGGRDRGEMPVVHLGSGDHRARRHVSDDGGDRAVFDEFLRDLCGGCAVGFVVALLDYELVAVHAARGVDFLERELDSEARALAVRELPRPGGADRVRRSAPGRRAACDREK
jgi:hypothetical protein